MSKYTVFVGMSGGVDSSVTALLLKQRGYNVVGVFLRCYNIDGCAERDAEDARRVAEHIGIPFYTWDFEEEYKQRVVQYMVEGYRAGLTPNPDVMCNREIKFGLFLERALAMGADYVATGHYVRLKEISVGSKKKQYALLEGIDPKKDQSYFLWTLSQDDLAHCLFPIGEYLKPDVRAIAAKAGLPTATKKDSQGICFLGDVSIEEFLKDYIPETTGPIVTTTGDVIGQHNGVQFYTIGQRHGLNLQEKNKNLGVHGSQDTQAHYVVSKDVATNTIVVAEGEQNEALYCSEITVLQPHFIRPTGDEDSVNFSQRVFARVRYRQAISATALSRINGKFIMNFEAPQRFVAEGQSVVWYSKEGEMLGGGIIG
jgi:tRNA-specific 2-thiouridylase